MKWGIAGIVTVATVAAALYARDAGAFGLGSNLFGAMGVVGSGSVSGPAPSGCASPTAPDGSVDLSKCSNALYAAIIF